MKPTGANLYPRDFFIESGTLYRLRLRTFLISQPTKKELTIGASVLKLDYGKVVDSLTHITKSPPTTYLGLVVQPLLR